MMVGWLVGWWVRNFCKHDCRKTIRPRHFKLGNQLYYDKIWIWLNFGDPRSIFDPWGVGSLKILVNAISQIALSVRMSNFISDFRIIWSKSDKIFVTARSILDPPRGCGGGVFENSCNRDCAKSIPVDFSNLATGNWLDLDLKKNLVILVNIWPLGAGVGSPKFL